MKKTIIRCFSTGMALLISLVGLGYLKAETFNVTPGGGACAGGSGGLQECLDEAAINGLDDTLLLEPGTYTNVPYTYTPAGEDFALTLINAQAEKPVIDGGNAESGLLIEAVLFADDNADITVSGIVVQNTNDGLVLGGGVNIRTFNADITVENCEFYENQKNANGAGLTAISPNGLIQITNNIFENNDTNPASTHNGGAASIQFESGGVVFSSNEVTSNTTGGDGGGIFISPIQTASSSVTLHNNFFFDNTAGERGGGFRILLTGGFPLTMTNNIVAQNTADTLQGGGGHISLTGSGTSLVMTHNTITDNASIAQRAGGLFVSLQDSDNTAQIYNNIIFNNQAGTVAPNLYTFEDNDGDNDGGEVQLFNNDQSDYLSFCRDEAPACVFSLVEGPNFNVDPLFVDPITGDYHLNENSPVIDQGDPNAPALPSTDFDGNPRPALPDTNPDIGALERTQELPPPPPEPEPEPEPEPADIFIQGSGTIASCALTQNSTHPWGFLMLLGFLGSSLALGRLRKFIYQPD